MIINHFFKNKAGNYRFGSGRAISEVNAFMKQFEQMLEMMKMMNKMPMGGRMMPGMRR